MHRDTVILNATLVTVNPDFDIIDPGILVIREGKIVHVGPMESAKNLDGADEKIDAAGKIALPGLVNTHTHLPMTLFRGLADDLPLFTWLNEFIFPAEARHLRPETVRWGTLLAVCEMLLSGTTTCCDGYFLEDHVAKAILDCSMRAILGQGVIDFPAPGVPDPSENVAVAIDHVRKWKSKSPLIKPSIFCHSPYTCSEKTLIRAKKAAAANGVLFQIHVAETEQELLSSIENHGMSPVVRLEKLGLLDDRTLLVHAVWVDETDIEIIQKSGARVSHVPESNMKLASGIAPIPAMVQAGIPVGLGTDGCASNNTLDLFGGMGITAKLHKVKTLDPTVMDAISVVRMATIDGARALGLENEIGSLEPGKLADIILIDTQKPHLTPMYSRASGLVYAARGADVSDVMIDGKFLVKDKRPLFIDREQIMDRVKALAREIGREK